MPETLYREADLAEFRENSSLFCGMNMAEI
jgi:hypothetical protein